MKKSTKKLIILLCACSFLAAAGVFVALWSTRLSPPKNLAVSDTGILTWDGCKNASLYVVNIDGEEYETDSTQLDIFFITDRYKDYNITVTAYPSLRSTKKPKTSELFIYTLKSPLQDEIFYMSTPDGAAYVADINNLTKAYDKIIFPSTYNGKPVVQVANSDEANQVRSILLSEGIKEIKEYGFYLSRAIKRVGLPSSLEAIGGGAFEYCDSLEVVDFNEGLKTIGSAAFYGCRRLKWINIPSTVQTIGSAAFYMCDNLSIILPSTVKSIGNGAFAGTVYTDASTLPKGWQTVYSVEILPQNELLHNFMAGKLFLNCKLNYEGEDVYVESLTYTDIPDMHQWMPYNSEPVRHGYTFKGWATERDGTVVYTMEQLLSYTGDGWPDDPKADKAPVVPYGTTLYPVWESA